MDTLQALFDSTAELYERFDVVDTPVLRRQRIFSEEVLELIQASAILHYESENGQGHDSNVEYGLRLDTANEAADVIVTVCGVLLAHGMSYADLEHAIDRVTMKNDSKTLDTHALINGKITRKQVTP